MLRKTFDYDSSMIINMDETAVYFDSFPRKTIDIKGKKIIEVLTTGSEKRRCTVCVTITASGEILRPMVIFNDSVSEETED